MAVFIPLSILNSPSTTNNSLESYELSSSADKLYTLRYHCKVWITGTFCSSAVDFLKQLPGTGIKVLVDSPLARSTVNNGRLREFVGPLELCFIVFYRTRERCIPQKTGALHAVEHGSLALCRRRDLCTLVEHGSRDILQKTGAVHSVEHGSCSLFRTR